MPTQRFELLCLGIVFSNGLLMMVYRWLPAAVIPMANPYGESLLQL